MVVATIEQLIIIGVVFISIGRDSKTQIIDHYWDNEGGLEALTGAVTFNGCVDSTEMLETESSLLFVLKFVFAPTVTPSISVCEVAACTVSEQGAMFVFVFVFVGRLRFDSTLGLCCVGVVDGVTMSVDGGSVDCGRGFIFGVTVF